MNFSNKKFNSIGKKICTRSDSIRLYIKFYIVIRYMRSKFNFRIFFYAYNYLFILFIKELWRKDSVSVILQTMTISSSKRASSMTNSDWIRLKIYLVSNSTLNWCFPEVTCDLWLNFLRITRWKKILAKKINLMNFVWNSQY